MQPGKKSVSVIDQIFHKTFMYVGGGREGWARVRGGRERERGRFRGIVHRDKLYAHVDDLDLNRERFRDL